MDLDTSPDAPSPAANADDGIALPCDQALLAATLALMTAYANPCPEARVDAATQRRLMARRIVSNLFFLREHPALGPGMRQVVGAVHGHWVALARLLEGAAATAPEALH